MNEAGIIKLLGLSSRFSTKVQAKMKIFLLFLGEKLFLRDNKATTSFLARLNQSTKISKVLDFLFGDFGL